MKLVFITNNDGDCECIFCGRVFSSEDDIYLDDQCPSDDCPSNNEDK